MAELPELWSVGGDARGEGALVYLPPRSSRSSQLLVACEGVTHCDIWSSVVIRTLLEYAATRLLMPVTLSLPRDQSVRRDFVDGVGALPNGVVLAAGSKIPAGQSKRVIMPSSRIQDTGFARMIAAYLPRTERSAGVEPRELAFLATALSQLTENALLHAKSPVDVVAGVGVDENEAHLVVADLGERIARHDDAAALLDEAWRTNERRKRKTPSGLPGITRTAEARSLDATLSIFSGTGRLFVRSGQDPQTLTEQPFVPGLVAAVVLHRDS